MSIVQKNTPSIIGRLKGLGITIYRRGDDIVARSSTKSQPSHQSVAQFRSRERVRRLIALWKAFPAGGQPVMETHDGLIPYRAFLRINSNIPTAFLTLQQHKAGGAVLVPGLCVSAGRIDPLGYHFEKHADGRRLLVTSLRTRLDADISQPLGVNTPEALCDLILGNDINPSLRRSDILRFYCLSQTVEHTAEADAPVLDVRFVDIPLNGNTPFRFLADHQLYAHKGFLAVDGPAVRDLAYAVAIIDPLHHTASTQTILTTSIIHKRFTTDAAASRAAASYGNVREKYLSPDDDKR